MLELIQGEGGVQPFDKNEIQKLATYLKEKDILLIVDEVQTGVYRTGKFLASQVYEIKPDIITLAKGLASGIPIGVTMTLHKNIFEYGDHGSTFGGNYLSTIVALKVCEILEKYKNSGRLDKKIQYFNQKLEKFYKSYPSLFTQIVGIGLIRGVRVKNEETLKLLLEKTLLNNVIVLRAGKNTLRFLPPLTITKKEIDDGFEFLHKGVSNGTINSKD
jgi:acetylornithine aminotransferase